jgi:hypothetical protein
MDIRRIEPNRIHPRKPPQQRIVIPRPHAGQAEVLVVGLAGEQQFVVGVGRLHRVAVGAVALFPDQVARGIRLRHRGGGDVVVEEGDQVGFHVEADCAGGAAAVVRIAAVDCGEAVRSSLTKSD